MTYYMSYTECLQYPCRLGEVEQKVVYYLTNNQILSYRLKKTDG